MHISCLNLVGRLSITTTQIACSSYRLSIQQLLDCDMTDLGCGCRLMDQAFQYDEDSVGVCPHSEYPFAYHHHWFYVCRRYMPYCEPLPSIKVKQYVNVTKTEEALKAAIATQPVLVAVSAGVVSGIL